jgi:hypothetical protein
MASGGSVCVPSLHVDLESTAEGVTSPVILGVDCSLLAPTRLVSKDPTVVEGSPQISPRSAGTVNQPPSGVPSSTATNRLHLMAWPITGQTSLQESYQSQLNDSWKDPSVNPLKNRTLVAGKDGKIGVCKGKWIVGLPLNINL